MADSGTDDGKNLDGSGEQSIVPEDDYERAMQGAFARMEKEFHLGEIPKLDREALHDRAPFWPREPL